MHRIRQLPFKMAVVCLVTGIWNVGWAAEFPDPCRDHEVRLRLVEEYWVATHTAKVSATVQVAADPTKAEAVRVEVLSLLRRLVPESGAPEGVWRITSAVLSRDAAGLERWQIQADIRAAERELPGLHDKGRRLSRPGMNIHVTIDWTPSTMEVESVKEQARKAIYRKAADEVERLNAASGMRYRLGDVEFVEAGVPARLALRTAADEEGKAEVMMAPQTAISRADRAVMQAHVALRERQCR